MLFVLGGHLLHKIYYPTPLFDISEERIAVIPHEGVKPLKQAEALGDEATCNKIKPLEVY
jgi:hypothetical protein